MCVCGYPVTVCFVFTVLFCFVFVLFCRPTNEAYRRWESERTNELGEGPQLRLTHTDGYIDDFMDKNAERGPQQVFKDYWKESKKAREYAQLMDKPLHAIGQEPGLRMKQIRNEQRNAADELYAVFKKKKKKKRRLGPM